MKSFLTKIVSYFLAGSLLFATSSFSVKMHFCCNKFVDMTVVGKAKVCKDKKAEVCNDKFNSDIATIECDAINDKDCCSNQSLLKKGNDVIKQVKNEFQADNIIVLSTFFYTYFNLFEGLEKNIIPLKKYRSPLLSKDIHILDETFLI